MSGNTRVAVVTGGTQGIGRKTAELLAKRGYRLAIIDLRQPAETVESIESKGGEAMGCAGDITDEATVVRFAGEVFERYGRADVLVNNAGISLISAAEDTAASDYRRVIEVNLVAPFLMAKAFGEKMQRFDRQRCIGCGVAGRCGPCSLQRIEAWADWLNPHARSRVGRAGSASERCLPGLGED